MTLSSNSGEAPAEPSPSPLNGRIRRFLVGSGG